MTLFEKIKEITEIQATSGHEEKMRDYLEKKMLELGYQPEFDGLGGIFVVKKSKASDAPRVMIASHMDEVGFLISQIKNDGTFRVVSLGGWNPLVVSAQRFTLFTSTGQEIPVITAGMPTHLTRGGGKEIGLPAISDIIFDGGFTDKAEAESFGVRQGDVIVPQTETILSANGKNVMAKAWDNRYGCLEVLELLDFLKNKELAVDLIIGANVQEEVGLRGAKVSTTKFHPDLFFAVDCSPAADTFGDENGKMGAGVTMRVFDPGHIMLPEMKNFLLATANEAQIKTQYYIAKGGTDAGAAHLANEGIPSTTIGVCARYIHSHQTLFSLDDFNQAQNYLRAIVSSLDIKTVRKINSNA
ncbi:MAG: glutamyl aminopeptidase [Streptococcaceae bacterium]|jgi:glutamyl aminopeptidase|nr:glutamyl aminopeptidase [Streptococcaceae bacterium]